MFSPFPQKVMVFLSFKKYRCPVNLHNVVSKQALYLRAFLPEGHNSCINEDGECGPAVFHLGSPPSPEVKDVDLWKNPHLE